MLKFVACNSIRKGSAQCAALGTVTQGELAIIPESGADMVAQDRSRILQAVRVRREIASSGLGPLIAWVTCREWDMFVRHKPLVGSGFWLPFLQTLSLNSNEVYYLCLNQLVVEVAQGPSGR